MHHSEQKCAHFCYGRGNGAMWDLQWSCHWLYQLWSWYITEIFWALKQWIWCQEMTHGQTDAQTVPTKTITITRYHTIKSLMNHIDGLAEERCNSSALAMELHLSYTKPSISCWYIPSVMTLLHFWRTSLLSCPIFLTRVVFSKCKYKYLDG